MSVIYNNGRRNIRVSTKNLYKGADLLAMLMVLQYHIVRVDVD